MPRRYTCQMGAHPARERSSEIPRSPSRCVSSRAKGHRHTTAGRIGDAILETSAKLGGAMEARDLREFRPEWVEPISPTYRGWTVYELPPEYTGDHCAAHAQSHGVVSARGYGFQSAEALHVMIEAKKLAYADMLRYVGDPRFGTTSAAAMLDKAHAGTRARSIDPARAAADVEPSVLDGLTNSAGGDTIYLSAIDKDGNIARSFRASTKGSGAALCRAGLVSRCTTAGLFTLEKGHPNVLAPRKRPLHTIIPGFMQKGSVRIGLGIMGGFNQAQAQAQFVANVADYGLDITGARGWPVHEGHVHGMRCVRGDPRRRVGPVATGRPRTRGHRCAAENRDVRLRASGDERWIGRALRRRSHVTTERRFQKRRRCSRVAHAEAAHAKACALHRTRRAR